ncbi:MAG: hypothetical protein ACRERE_44750, partial [Candidatus Entotheonellia bacterium]
QYDRIWQGRHGMSSVDSMNLGTAYLSYGTSCPPAHSKWPKSSPSNPLSSITVDTGLMLIALIECLEDRDTAIDAIREILWRAVNKIAPEGVQGKTKEDISLNEQIELLKIWEENRNKGSLIGVCIVAAHLLFDIKSKPGDKEHSRTVGEISAALVDDAWEVIVTTENAFGWNIETRTS